MHKNIAFHFVYIALLFICQVIKLHTKAVKKSFFGLNTNFRLSTISRRIKNKSCDQDRSCFSKNFRSDKSIYREQYNVTVNISPKEVHHVHEILSKIAISSRLSMEWRHRNSQHNNPTFINRCIRYCTPQNRCAGR